MTKMKRSYLSSYVDAQFIYKNKVAIYRLPLLEAPPLFGVSFAFLFLVSTGYLSNKISFTLRKKKQGNL